MGAISQPEFVTKEQHMVKLRVQKLVLDLILFQKEILKRNVRSFSAHFFLLWSKATIFLCHMEAISWLKVTRVVCGWKNIFIIDDKYNKFSVHLLKDVRNFAGRGDHRLLWLKATTSLSRRGAISRT